MGHRIPFLIVPLLALVCACGAGHPPPASRLPFASVLTLAGQPTRIERLAQGRVALVSLWATWCDGCQREVEALNRLHESTAARRDAVVIGVAVGEPRDKVAAFVRSRGLRYMQLVDEDFRFVDALGERRVPTTLVIDRAGRIVYRGDAFDATGLAALRGTVANGP